MKHCPASSVSEVGPCIAVVSSKSIVSALSFCVWRSHQEHAYHANNQHPEYVVVTKEKALYVEERSL